jgi:hypothetical protein
MRHSNDPLRALIECRDFWQLRHPDLHLKLLGKSLGTDR